jgi:enamine deaminase RidA (YjgF/YER057c/UK114 family)
MSRRAGDDAERSDAEERRLSSGSSWRSRLAELGVELPEPVTPVASYLPAVRTGNLVFTAGQVPMQAGKLAGTGKVGAEVSPEEGSALARICAVNALAAVDALVGIDAVTRVVKVVGYVASAPGFNGQPGVINGASDLLGAVFGEAGGHARSAVGVSELPLDAPVEVELVLQINEAVGGEVG